MWGNKDKFGLEPSLVFELNNVLAAAVKVRSSYYEEKLLSPVISLSSYSDGEGTCTQERYKAEVAVLIDGMISDEKDFEYWFNMVEDIGDGYSTWHYISKTCITADYSNAMSMLEKFIIDDPICRDLGVKLM